MTKIYVLQRVIGAVAGNARLVVPVMAFSSLSEASKAAAVHSDALRAAMRTRLHDEAGDTGLQLGRFLQDLGLSGFQHGVDELDLAEDKLIVTPDPPTILLR